MTTTTKKMSIPSVNAGTIQNTSEATRFLDAVKQNLDIITGRQGGGEVLQLPPGASTALIIETLNQIIVKLNASGS